MGEGRNKWKNIGVTEKFNVAFEGIFETIRTEKHMKFHCFCTIVIFILSLFLDIGKYESLAIIVSVSLIWLAEFLIRPLKVVWIWLQKNIILWQKELKI